MAGSWLVSRAHDFQEELFPLSSLAEHMAVGAFTGIAWYNVAELSIAVYMTFRRRSGLYFWAVLLSIQGILIHSLAYILKLYDLAGYVEVAVGLTTVGWYLMVTGQSVVLYSRLHLVVNEPMVIRAVLVMIIWNAITLHIPTTVLTFGCHSSKSQAFAHGFKIMEKIQMVIFSVQEFIISSLYIWATIRFLRPVYKRHIRSVMLQLIWINVIIIVMDIGMVSISFFEFYSMEAVMKSAVYGVKLKLEFAVLNQLMRLAKTSRNDQFTSGEEIQRTPGRPSESRRGLAISGAIKRFLEKIVPAPGSFTIDGNCPANGKPSESWNEASGNLQRSQPMISIPTMAGTYPVCPSTFGIAISTKTETAQPVNEIKSQALDTNNIVVFGHCYSSESAAPAQLGLAPLPPSPVSPQTKTRRLTPEYPKSPITSKSRSSGRPSGHGPFSGKKIRPSVGNIKGGLRKSSTSSEATLQSDKWI